MRGVGGRVPGFRGRGLRPCLVLVGGLEGREKNLLEAAKGKGKKIYTREKYFGKNMHIIFSESGFFEGEN